MKKWAALVCAFMMALAPVGWAEGFTPEEWAAVKERLASDTPLPVPREKRAVPGRREVYVQNPQEAASGFANLLLLSTDAPDIDENFGRAEALVACRVNLTTGESKLLSLPEYALLEAPEWPEPVALQYVNCFGGPRLTLSAVNRALGLSLNRYCAVNPASLAFLVDDVGGVTLTLTADEAEALGLTPGTHHLTGEQAYRYARLRRQWDGIQRYKALLEGVVRQASASGGLLNGALTLLDLALPYIDTDMTMDELLNLAFALFAQEELPAFSAQRAHAAGPDEALTGAAEESAAFLYGEEAP